MSSKLKSSGRMEPWTEDDYFEFLPENTHKYFGDTTGLSQARIDFHNYSSFQHSVIAIKKMMRSING